MALTIEQIQENITNGGDVRQIINQLADYVEANPGGGSPGGDSGYLGYGGWLTQSGTSAPTNQVALNTLGGNTALNRQDVGIYRITNDAAAFTGGGKTIVLFPSISSNSQNMVLFTWVSTGIIQIETFASNGDGTWAYSDDILDGSVTFKIEVYP